MRNALFTFAFLSISSIIYAQEETVPRKVLILDFANQAKDAKSDYLSVSIAEALLDPLKKTGKFFLLPRNSSAASATQSTPIFDEAEAIRRAKIVEADVVVIGNFISLGEKIQIQTKVVDVHTAQIVVAKTHAGKLDSSIFDTIQMLANDMSSAMAAALPPIPKQIIIREQVGFGLYAKNFVSHALLGSGISFAVPSAYLRPGISGLADFQFEFLHRFIIPYFSFAGIYSSGLKTVNNMWIFTGIGGLSYSFRFSKGLSIIKHWSVTPFLGAGASFGTIKATPDLEAQSFSYNVFTISTGATLDAFLSDKWSIALSLRGNYLFESQTPLPILYLQMGVGYKL